jgi:hypothetical protein
MVIIIAVRFIYIYIFKPISMLFICIYPKIIYKIDLMLLRLFNTIL